MRKSTTQSVAARWIRQPERSNLLLMRLMAWLSLAIGRTLTRLMLPLIALYFLLTAGPARRASAAYLNRALGRRAGLRDCYRQIVTFATTIHDRIYFLSDRFDLFDIEVVGEDALRAAAAQGRGVILLGAHLGSFEALRALARLRGGPRVSMVMYEDNARKIGALFSAINPTLARDIIALGQVDSMLQVREALDRGQYVGILADRELGPGGERSADFLGAPARFPLGPLRMAALLRRPAYFMTGLHLGGNRYQIHFAPLGDFAESAGGQRDRLIARASDRYVQLLEHYCRIAPYNWFNFYDFWGATASY